MGLIELKQHLMQARMTTLREMAKHFCCDPELLRSMLQHWVRKGCLRHYSKTAACGKSCNDCSTVDREIYEWVQA